MRDQSGDGGKPGPDPSDDELDLLKYVYSQDGHFGTVTNVNQHTSVGRKQTQNRLDELVERGLLNRRLVGRTNVYWLTDQGEKLLSRSLLDD